MCGIAGFINYDSDWPKSKLERVVTQMTDTLIHRGPDADGIWVDPKKQVALGHRRLSIIDLSERGNQPMVSHSGRYVISYNGEVYNFKDIRAELICAGIKFVSECDTEVILASIEQWGLDGAVRRFNGMFAFALWDSELSRLFLVRDRMGEKPLYYTFIGGGVVFGSELKAFFKHEAFVPEIDVDSVALFMKYCYIPAPSTIFKNVFKLPPATIMKIESPSKFSMTEYWSLNKSLKSNVSDTFDDAVDKLDRLLRDSVEMRLNSDVPLGVFLSGGVDSSVVAAIAGDVGSGELHTFTIGFDDGGFDESRYAEAVSGRLGAKHTTIKISQKDMIEALNSLPYVYDEPFADSSQLLELVLSKKSREYITVALTGDGGDESFIGYDRYLWLARLGGIKKAIIRVGFAFVPIKLITLFMRGLRRILPKWFFFTDIEGKTERLSHLVCMDNQIQMYEWLNSYWRDPSEVVIGAKNIKGGIPLTDNIITSIALNDTLLGLPNDMLVKVDRSTMSVGLEARVPLLDHNVVEYAWGLPLGYKLRNGMTKAVLRKVLSKYIPSNMTDRPKAGFSAPIASWLRGSLRGWAEGLLDWNSIKDDGFLDPRPIKERWERHLAGEDFHKELWTVLIFQQWLNANRARVCK